MDISLYDVHVQLPLRARNIHIEQHSKANEKMCTHQSKDKQLRADEHDMSSKTKEHERCARLHAGIRAQGSAFFCDLAASVVSAAVPALASVDFSGTATFSP